MKIFLPFQKDLNSYLDEIQNYSVHSFIYGNFMEYKPIFEIVNIHWPEALFGWHEPSNTQLEQLKLEILNWKKHAVLIYTKHDAKRNKGTTPIFSKLFKIIEENTDVFIHLGQYSKNSYEKKYPKAIHRIVPHPLYETSFKKISKVEAREKLNIDKQALVVIAPGNIRTFGERKLVFHAFNALKIKNKVLICTNMRTEIRLDFPGRVLLKKIFDIRNYVVKKFKGKYHPPKYIFTYNKIDDKELSLKMSAADLVLVPRKEILNSGIVFLGLTFQKIIVGPAIGNIKEQLLELHMPTFDPSYKNSVLKALKKGMEMHNRSEQIEWQQIKKYEPNLIANQMDRVFTESVSCEK